MTESVGSHRWDFLQRARGERVRHILVLVVDAELRLWKRGLVSKRGVVRGSRRGRRGKRWQRGRGQGCVED
jgi:hypothetical protein